MVNSSKATGNGINSARVESICVELVSLCSKEDIEGLHSLERKDVRGDMLTTMLRDAVGRSSLGMYNGCVYCFTGRIYEPLSNDEFGEMVYAVMRALGVRMGDYGKIESIIRVLRRKVGSRQLRVTTDVMVFRNCMLRIDTGEVMPFSRDYVQLSCVDYDYDADAVGTIWDQFLKEVLPDGSSRAILQEFIGALFIDRHKVRIEQMMILKGSGSNGKSVVFDTLMGILGHNNVTNFGLDELVGSGTERKRNVATMNGKRLNYASETRRFTIDGGSGSLKALISGEPMEARAMYGENFVARDIPLIMINTNHMPELRDWSYGMRRRIMLLPFDVEIPRWKQNPELPEWLKKEYPYIFNWAMAGRARFISNGYKFTNSDAIDELIDDYHAESSTMLMFLRTQGFNRDRGVVLDMPPVWVPFGQLYNDYAEWCTAHDEYIETKRKASRVLNEAGYGRKRLAASLYIALFGEAAMRYKTTQMRYARARREMNEIASKRGLQKKTMREVRDLVEGVMLDNKWRRVAAGFAELKEYLGYDVDIGKYMMNGSFEGMYLVADGLYIFNLDSIDRHWRPEYESKIRKKIENRESRKEQEKFLKQLQNEQQAQS